MLLRVATFNARHAADGSWLFRHRALTETCRAFDADIIGLQEVDRRVQRTWWRDQPKIVARRLSMRHVTAPAKVVPGGGRQCNALLTRGSLRQVEIMEMPRLPKQELRTAILARVALPALELTVACTHLHHRPRGAALPQLKALLVAMRARPGPHLLLGDLNLAPEHAEPVIREAGFTPVLSDFTSPRRAPREQIDWVAFDGPFAVERVEVRQPLVSDHLALVVTLRTGDQGISAASSIGRP
jgi:endonuclease/exonuclease/phosphatase family metal-dependent hydrolase